MAAGRIIGAEHYDRRAYPYLTRLRWPSRHPEIGEGPTQTPAEFKTTSHVCLIANEWWTVNTNVKAVEDRAIILNFTPHVGEVHIKVREWFSNQEVYDFIELHLPHIRHPSMRHYVKGDQLQRANPDTWRDQLLTIIGLDQRTRAMLHILHNPALCSDGERVARFQAMGLGDRATYYRWKKKLASGAVPFNTDRGEF